VSINLAPQDPIMPLSPVRARPAVVLTVDEHPLMRSALREVLHAIAQDIELIEASNPEEGLASVGRRPHIDLIVLDLNFSRHNGLVFVERYRAAAPAVPLVILTMHEDAPTLKQALACGAAGIIPKTHSARLVQRAIELVMEGGVYLPPDFTRQLAAEETGVAGRPAEKRKEPFPMSEQQLKILGLVANGLSNKEIARKLGLASSTVKNQLTVVFDRLGVSNRTQAAISARTLLQPGRELRHDGHGAR
jgi:DNA-binding NarL/FixJ family response regulator